MIHIILFLFTSAGFSMLCLARDRHQRDILGRKLSPAGTIWLRRSGFSCLLIALLIAETSLGWAYGAVEWIGLLSIGALLTLILLSRHSTRRSSSR